MYLLCNLTPLLVVVATIGVAFGAPDCYGAQSYYQNQLPMYEHMHKWMNLTMDCNAVYSAVDAVQRHSKGEKDTVMEEYWCKYSRYTWGRKYYGNNWLSRTVLREMDWNLVVHTAFFHRNTKYGCGATEHNGIFNHHYYLVCIYEKTSNNRCYIEWTYPW